MKFFLDSSILIEYIKGNQTTLLDEILKLDATGDLCINHIVFSEFMFHFLGLMANQAPLTLKNKSKIKTLLEQHTPIHFIKQFKVVAMNESSIQKSYEYMRLYNFLPNDALILATCNHENIPCLLSYDNDFKEPCDKENIQFISAVDQISPLLK